MDTSLLAAGRGPVAQAGMILMDQTTEPSNLDLLGRLLSAAFLGFQRLSSLLPRAETEGWENFKSTDDLHEACYLIFHGVGGAIETLHKLPPLTVERLAVLRGLPGSYAFELDLRRLSRWPGWEFSSTTATKIPETIEELKETCSNQGYPPREDWRERLKSTRLHVDAVCLLKTEHSFASNLQAATAPNGTKEASLDVTLTEATQNVQAYVAKRYRRAYLSFQYAEEKVGEPLKDEIAYAWLKENGIDSNLPDKFTDLEDYQLPDEKDTWLRYMREGRSAAGRRKNHPRAGRKGRSIAQPSEL